jgi:hypothetical protein
MVFLGSFSLLTCRCVERGGRLIAGQIRAETTIGCLAEGRGSSSFSGIGHRRLTSGFALARVGVEIVAGTRPRPWRRRSCVLYR